MPKEEQDRLAAAGLEPQSAVDAALNAKGKGEVGTSFGKTFGVAVEIRACGCCGNGKGVGVKLRKCDRCMLVDYCSRECQKKHWRVHKPKCLSVSKPESVEAEVHREAEEKK